MGIAFIGTCCFYWGIAALVRNKATGSIGWFFSASVTLVLAVAAGISYAFGTALMNDMSGVSINPEKYLSGGFMVLVITAVSYTHL